MGSSAIRTIAIGLFMMVIAVYFATDTSNIIINSLKKLGVIENEFVKKTLEYFYETKDSQTKSQSGKTSEILLTPEQLKNFDGSAGNNKLYLAILGDVFDVEKGAQHYRPGGGYSFFTGKDATRAYITGDFSEKGLTDDVTDLDATSLGGLKDWLSFYRDEYKLVGKVIGRYYDKNGDPTKELMAVREKMNKAVKSKWLDEQNKDIFPPCNSEWSQEKGSKVWCTNKSGGVDRSWVGVPRALHSEGRDPRCVCVKNSGPPSSEADGDNSGDRGDLDHPGLEEYRGCDSSAISCNVDHP